jgi:small subunit ribosomal protein S15
VLAREQKKSLIDQYGTHPTDTGSPEVQIALLSERIGQLQDHFKAHLKDHGSRRGLLMLVSKRRLLHDYIKKYDTERSKTVVQRLGLRKEEAFSVGLFVPMLSGLGRRVFGLRESASHSLAAVMNSVSSFQFRLSETLEIRN